MNTETPVCAICLDDLEETDKIILKCSHQYHFKCFMDCVSESLQFKKCPLCRTTFYLPENIENFLSKKDKILEFINLYETNDSFYYLFNDFLQPDNLPEQRYLTIPQMLFGFGSDNQRLQRQTAFSNLFNFIEENTEEELPNRDLELGITGADDIEIEDVVIEDVVIEDNEIEIEIGTTEMEIFFDFVNNI